MKPAFNITQTANWDYLSRQGFVKIAFLNPGRILFGYGAVLRDQLGADRITIEPRYQYNSSTNGYRKVWWIAARNTGTNGLTRHWYVPTRHIRSTVEQALALQSEREQH